MPTVEGLLPLAPTGGLLAVVGEFARTPSGFPVPEDQLDRLAAELPAGD
jgi:hypothetical protein